MCGPKWEEPVEPREPCFLSGRCSVSETMVEAAGFSTTGHSHDTCTAEPSHARLSAARSTSPQGGGGVTRRLDAIQACGAGSNGMVLYTNTHTHTQTGHVHPALNTVTCTGTDDTPPISHHNTAIRVTQQSPGGNSGSWSSDGCSLTPPPVMFEPRPIWLHQCC